MRRVLSIRRFAPLALCGIAFMPLCVASNSDRSHESFVENGHAGFVVSHIEYALGKDAEETGACPNGMTLGYQSPLANLSAGPGGDRKENESPEAARKRFFQMFSAPNGQNLCQHPEAGQPNPNFRTVSGANVAAFGIDMDGENSRHSGQCSHDDFIGMKGEAGIDNQFYRVVGCSNSFQSTGQSNTYAIGMLAGEWGILITLDGVDDIENDDSVEVGIYSNADPIQLSPSREPLPYATYAIDQDQRFRTTAKGRIVNGVLTTQPVDMLRFRWVVNSIRLERPLRDARVQMTLNEEGILEGYVAGYAPVEDAYDFQYGFRNGTNGKGEPADLRLRTISSSGQAAVQGHTCEGGYYALHQFADGHPDAETGKCTSISTQYKIKAIPAYVVDVATESQNEDLIN